MTPESTSTSTTFWLNNTEIHEKVVASAPLAVGATPRWVLLARALNTLDTTRNTSTAVLIIDSDREKELGLGRGWDHPPLGKNEAHVTRSVLSSIGVTANAGETILLRLDIPQFLTELGILNEETLETLIESQLIGAGADLDLSNITVSELVNVAGPVLEALGINVTAIIDQLAGKYYKYLNTYCR